MTVGELKCDGGIRNRSYVVSGPLRVKSRRTGASPGRFAPEGEADGNGGKEDVPARMSAPGGKAVVPAARPKQPLIAEAVL